LFTLLLSGRSHLVSDEMGQKLLDAMEARRAYEWIQVEMNGEGSGFWDAAINVQQIVALIRHPGSTESEHTSFAGLRLVPTS
jgi:hypothetical protein